MAHELVRDDFTEDDLDEVQDFRCGDLYYQKEVSDWLKGREGDCALTDISKVDAPARVWLYRDEEERLVGFGSLAPSEWRWTANKDPWIPVNTIIWCGLHVDFQRDLYEPKHMRYSNQIMDDLVGEAREEREKFPVLGLYVQEENEPAIKLYRRFKFFSEGLKPHTDKATNITYQKMALILDREALLRCKELDKQKRS